MATAAVLPRKPVQAPFATPKCCPNCGHDVPATSPEEAQRRISDLEAQVRLLNSKAAAAVDKLADYEDEVRALRSQCAQLQEQKPSQERPLPAAPPPPAEPPSISRLPSLSSFLPGRRVTPRVSDPREVLHTAPPYASGGNNYSSPNLSVPAESTAAGSSPPSATANPGNAKSPTLVSLQTSLENERELRQKAESSLTQAQKELEELTAQLFGQANEMVATERKARAKLEERVKLLETRDTDKRKRLERLEKAVERIERVRKMMAVKDEKLATA